MKVFFVDTNILLQCRDLSELPWGEVSEDEDLLILISRPVQEEIDRLKQDGNTRRAKRARKTTSFFRKIISSDDSKLIIRDSGPRVEISFSPIRYKQTIKFDQLDLSQADDRIINEALSYSSANPDQKVELLTHDTNPMVTAKLCGLLYSVIPDDWLLAPEPDSRDKKILELENRVRELEKSSPQIELSAQDETGTLISSLSIKIATYDKLSEEKINALITEVCRRSPLVDVIEKKVPSSPPPSLGGSTVDRMLGIEWHYEHPDSSKIENYREVEYPEWIENVRKCFKNLHAKLEYPNRLAAISFALINSGSIPAENLVIEFEAEGGLLFVPPKTENTVIGQQQKIELPPPPSPPKGKWVKRRIAAQYFSSMHLADSVSPLRYDNLLPDFIRNPVNHQKDRNTFYWKGGKPHHYKDIWIFECQEFRHQVDKEIFEMSLFVPVAKEIKKAVVKCLVTAKNLPKPIIFHLPVEVNYFKEDIEAKAHLLIEQSKSYKLEY